MSYQKPLKATHFYFQKTSFQQQKRATSNGLHRDAILLIQNLSRYPHMYTAQQMLKMPKITNCHDILILTNSYIKHKIKIPSMPFIQKMPKNQKLLQNPYTNQNFPKPRILTKIFPNCQIKRNGSKILILTKNVLKPSS